MGGGSTVKAASQAAAIKQHNIKVACAIHPVIAVVSYNTASMRASIITSLTSEPAALLRPNCFCACTVALLPR